jgi:hypothetical protein
MGILTTRLFHPAHLETAEVAALRIAIPVTIPLSHAKPERNGITMNDPSTIGNVSYSTKEQYNQLFMENSQQVRGEDHKQPIVETAPLVMEERRNQPNIRNILNTIEIEDRKLTTSDIPHIMQEGHNPEVQEPGKRRRGRPRIHSTRPIPEPEPEPARPCRVRGRPRKTSRRIAGSTRLTGARQISGSKRRPGRPTRQEVEGIILKKKNWQLVA